MDGEGFTLVVSIFNGPPAADSGPLPISAGPGAAAFNIASKKRAPDGERDAAGLHQTIVSRPTRARWQHRRRGLHFTPAAGQAAFAGTRG